MKYLVPVAAVAGVVGALAAATPAMAHHDMQITQVGPNNGGTVHAHALFKPWADSMELCATNENHARVEVRERTGDHKLVYTFSVVDASNDKRMACKTVTRDTSSQYDLEEGKVYRLILSSGKLSNREFIYNMNNRGHGGTS